MTRVGTHIFRKGKLMWVFIPDDKPWVFEEPYKAHLDPIDLDKYEIPEHLQVSNPKNSRGDNSQKGSTDV